MMPFIHAQKRAAAARCALAAVLVLVLVPLTPVRAAGLLAGEAAATALAAAYAPTTADNRTGAIIVDSAVNTAWQRTLRIDPDLKFSPTAKRLVYGCACIAKRNQTTAAAAALAASSAVPTAAAAEADASGFAFPNELDPLIADAFRLHSRPGAAKKIVLDFTGHTLRAGTGWGQDANKNGDVPIVTPPYDLDNNPSSFSSAEKQAIVSIWRTVAEDYSAWDVDVTTEEPAGTDDEADASLVGIGTRVAIGKNNGWFDNAGGVAFIDGFAEQWAGPVAFVFNDNAANAAIAISHEVGHTLGLRHHGNLAKPDGTGASGYYFGHGSWAPIMGVGYGKNVIQWSKGDYAYASEPNQDDIATIGSKLDQAPYLGGGRDTGSAEALPVAAATPANVSGIFTSADELHVYRFSASSSGTLSLTLSVNPRGPQGNSRTHLAAKVRVLRSDASSVVGAPFNNVGPNGIDGNIPKTPTMTFDLPASGIYYIEMSAAGTGNPTTGYTEYGSSGTYALSVSGTWLLGGDGGPMPPAVRCLGTTSVQLTSAAGNCVTGWAVRAEDLYTTPDGRAATVLPPVGTAVAGGTSRVFSAALDGIQCTTTVAAAACQAVAVSDNLTCRSPSYTLAAGQCGGLAVPLADLFTLSAGAGSATGAPAGTATTTLPADGVVGPGVTRIDVRATAGGATCTSVVTITPCKPVVMSTTVAAMMPSSPGTCAGTPAPAAVVSAATLGRGALSINARTTATGSVVPAPLKAGKYYVQVVYPGGVLSAVSAAALPLAVSDVEPPAASLKPTFVRDAAGFICARGLYSTSTTACLSVSTASTGVLVLEDNCGVETLTRSYQCAGVCPTSLSPTASKLCVAVKAGGGRTEATFRLTVTDKGGRQAQVLIPIAAYHYRDKPAALTCYTA